MEPPPSRRREKASTILHQSYLTRRATQLLKGPQDSPEKVQEEVLPEQHIEPSSSKNTLKQKGGKKIARRKAQHEEQAQTSTATAMTLGFIETRRQKRHASRPLISVALLKAAHTEAQPSAPIGKAEVPEYDDGYTSEESLSSYGSSGSDYSSSS